ncbi:MAG: MFS transporter, partial [Chloroflexi bacterium]
MQRTITQALRLALGISFFAFILIGMNDGAVGVLLPGMQTTYHTGKDTISLLFLAGTFGYFTASFNNGLLLDKLGNRRFLLLATLMMGLGFALLSNRPPFFLLLLGIVPIGFGVAMLDAGFNSYIASLPNKTALLNYLHAFYGTGALLGPLVASSFLALGWVWNSVYFVWIGIAVLVFIGIALAFPREKMTSHEEEQKAGGNVLFLALRQRVVWLAALFLLFYVGTEVSLGSWSFSFLTQERHGQILFSGWIVSGYWVGLTLGRLLLGKVAQRIGSRRLIEACLCGVVVGILLVWVVPQLAV